MEAGNDEEIEPGSEPLLLGPCMERALQLTKRRLGIILLVGLVYLGISIAASLAGDGLDSMMGYHPPAPTAENAYAVMQNSHSPWVTILLTLLDWFLGLGWTRIALQLVSGKEAKVSMLFGEGAKYPRIVGANIIYMAMVIVGTVFLIVPGIYLALRFGHFQYAIVEKDMGIMEAFQYSSRITRNSRMTLLAMHVLNAVIVIAGVVALLIGVIFAVPFVLMVQVVAYRWLSRGSKSLGL